MPLHDAQALILVKSRFAGRGQGGRATSQTDPAMNQVSAATYVGPDYPRWTETLTDGSRVLIRTICSLDAELERQFIEGLSIKARHNRFLGVIAHPSDEFLEKLTDIDYINDVALVAVTQGPGPEQIVGVSRYAADRARDHCESAVVVADAWQGKGLGTALMTRLIEVARKRGLRTMESTDLADNTEMRELARYLGFDARTDPDDPHMVTYTLSLQEGA